MTYTRHGSILTLVLFVAAIPACQPNDGVADDTQAGPGEGGNVGKGAAGGVVTSKNATTAPTGGKSSTGGNPSIGGTGYASTNSSAVTWPSTGGRSSAGGSQSTSRNSSNGGRATGGASLGIGGISPTGGRRTADGGQSTGGSSTGGRWSTIIVEPSTGGWWSTIIVEPSTGGKAPTGGRSSAGASPSTGGAALVGGSLSFGGQVMTGGTTSLGGNASGGNASGGNASGNAGSSAGTAPISACDAPSLVWKSANKTNYTSYPDPGSEECIEYNGCQWAGQFAACDDTKTEQWVSTHNIVAAFPDFGALELHDLCLRKGQKTIVVTVLDTCGDSDCSGCCTKNKGSADELIDIESYTDARWGVPDGPIEWADLGPTKTQGCN